MSELPTPGPMDQSIFEEKTIFEINDIAFKEIQVNVDRIIGIGKKWTRFELLLSFIGAAWMEKWRRFGVKVLGAGVAIILFSFWLMMPTYYPNSLQIFGILFMFIGIAVAGVWALIKREALLLFTPGGMFKIEGAANFIESLWKVIAPKLE